MPARRYRPTARSRTRLGTRITLVLVAGFVFVPAAVLTACGGGNSPAQAPGLAAYLPAQAVVLDGSADPADVFFVSLTEDGYLLDVGEADVDCPGTGNPSSAGLFQIYEGAGIHVSAGELPVQVIPLPPLVPGELPASLQGLVDDCDVWARATAVEAYITAVGDKTADDLAVLEVYFELARQRYCEIVATVEAEPTLPIVPMLTHASIPTYSIWPPPSSPVGWPCGETRLSLQEMPYYLDDLSTRVHGCQVAADELADIQLDLGSPGGTGMPSNSKATILHEASFWLWVAKASQSYGQAVVAALDGLKASLKAESLEAACDKCLGLGNGTNLPGPQGAVIQSTQWAPLGRIVDAFLLESSASRDPAEADRFMDIAHRLERVPEDRVLFVTYKSMSAVGQDLIAIRSANALDDGVSPLVMVLRALPMDAPLPPMNTADQAILFDAYRTFHVTLTARAGAR